MDLLKLLNRTADPAADVDTSIVYAKDVQAASQAFVRTGDGRQPTYAGRTAPDPDRVTLGRDRLLRRGDDRASPREHTLDADIAGNTVTLRFRRGAVLLVPSSRRIGSRLDFSEGGLIQPSAGDTVTINGPV